MSEQPTDAGSWIGREDGHIERIRHRERTENQRRQGGQQ
jgi:hypothetical protein